MARECFLVCTSCKEFMNIYKFKILPHIHEKPALGIDGIQISLLEIDEGIKNSTIDPENKNNHWIFELRPFITKFSTEHANHHLRIVDDSGPDYYWWPEHSGYTEWKEIVTPLDNELFLPRNLVDDLKINEWNTALHYLQSLRIVLFDELELTEYINKFNQLTQATPNED